MAPILAAQCSTAFDSVGCVNNSNSTGTIATVINLELDTKLDSHLLSASCLSTTCHRLGLTGAKECTSASHMHDAPLARCWSDCCGYYAQTAQLIVPQPLAPSSLPIRLLVATLVSALPGDVTRMHYICQLPAFCKHATEFRDVASADPKTSNNFRALHIDVGVLTYNQWNISRECPGALGLLPDEEFVNVVQQMYRPDNHHYNGSCHMCGWRTASVQVLKWWLVRLRPPRVQHAPPSIPTRCVARGPRCTCFSLPSRAAIIPPISLLCLLKVKLVAYDVVLFYDLDIDFSRFLAIHLRALRRSILAFHSSNATLSGPSDWAVPVNGGSFVIRPSHATYDEGLALLRTRTFNTTVGLGGIGRPRSLIKTPHRQYDATRLYMSNTWNVAGGASDQGLFAIFYHIRASAVRYSPPRFSIGIQHFWGPTAKPTAHCRRWVAWLQLSPDSMCNGTVTKWLQSAGNSCSRKTLLLI